MNHKFIETENFIMMHEMMTRLAELEGNAERMGLAYGHFGLGKTMSLERIASEFDAILLRTNQTWTISSVLKLLADEMAIDAKGKSSDVMERVVYQMNRDHRPIIIDEIDTLLPAKKFEILELFRDIHDQTKNIFVMVGMESCDARLKLRKHFYSRIITKAKFTKIPRGDIEKFCSQAEVKIEDDLIDYFLSQYPNLRQIKVLILRLEAFGELNGVTSISLKLFKQSGVENAER